MKRPITRSCIVVVLDKQIVRRTSRLIRVRRLLDSLRVLLANVMLRWVDMPFVRSPSVGVKSRDAKGLQQVLEFEKDGILPSPKDVRQHRATVMIDGMP